MDPILNINLNVLSGALESEDGALIINAHGAECLEGSHYQPLKDEINQLASEGKSNAPLAFIAKIESFRFRPLLYAGTNGFLDRVALAWFDGPTVGKSWDEIQGSEFEEEYKVLSVWLSDYLNMQPENSTDLECNWKFEWGGVSCLYDTKSMLVRVWINWKK